MSTEAIQKTKAHKRTFLPVEALEGQEINPNEMTDAEFNMLADNVEQMGITDPILVRPKTPEEITADRPASHRIVGGWHRWEVAKLLGFHDVPVTIVTDTDFDADKERFQIVRMNVIRGKISPQKFIQMYSQMSEKYADSVLADSFGFANEEEFKKLIAAVKKQLPKDMQADFQKAASELKTIDDLSKLLQRLFTAYGDTLPYGFMVFDFGGKESIWLRLSNDTKKAVLSLGALCKDHQRSMDSLIGGLLRQATTDPALQQVLVQLIAQAPEVEIPEAVQLPTDEVLAGTIQPNAGALL